MEDKQTKEISTEDVCYWSFFLEFGANAELDCIKYELDLIKVRTKCIQRAICIRIGYMHRTFTLGGNVDAAIPTITQYIVELFSRKFNSQAKCAETTSMLMTTSTSTISPERQKETTSILEIPYLWLGVVLHTATFRNHREQLQADS